MTQTFKWTGLVLFAAAIGLALAVLFASGAQAESPVAVVQRAVVQPTPNPGPAGYGSWGMGPGMMGSYGYGHMGGMMGSYGGWGYGSGAAPRGTPVPVDEEIQLEAANFRFDPAIITVKAGETVRLVVANKDGAPHNLYSQEAALAYTLLPAGVVQSVTFTAPATPATYLAACTFHPGMNLEIVVK